jgi:hypothetical protein
MDSCFVVGIAEKESVIFQDHQLCNSQIMIVLILKMAGDHFGYQMFVYIDGE